MAVQGVLDEMRYRYNPQQQGAGLPARLKLKNAIGLFQSLPFCFPSSVFRALQQPAPAFGNRVDDPVTVIFSLDQAAFFQDIQMILQF